MSPRFLFERLRGHGATVGDGGQGGQDGREQLPCWATSKFKEMTPLNISTAKFAKYVFVGQVAVETPLRRMSTLQRSP